MPFDVAQSSGCQLRGQTCYVEITLGCSSKCNDKISEPAGKQNKNAVQHPKEEAQMASAGRSQQKQGPSDQFAILQRTFIYQPATVLVPLMHRAFARTSLKRYLLLPSNTCEAVFLLVIICAGFAERIGLGCHCQSVGRYGSFLVLHMLSIGQALLFTTCFWMRL